MMTAKERMLAAMRNEEPDRVPASPDISNMVPARLTGKPFWDIYRHRDPPLWKAYLAAARRFKMDAWLIYAKLGGGRRNPDVERRNEIVFQNDEKIVQRNYVSTPDGDLWREVVYFRDQPSWISKRYVTDLPTDYPKLLHLAPDTTNLNDRNLKIMMEETGEDGAVGGSLSLPTLMFGAREGGIAKALRDYYQHHDLVMDLTRRDHERVVEIAKQMVEAEPDFIFIGNSGLWLMQGEKITREISLPTLKEVTKIASKNDIPTLLHCCGPERRLAEICARETKLDCINPVEQEPFGDCDLLELKNEIGDRLSIMGNLPTMTLMYRGTYREVVEESRRAIEAAGEGGGFILSTGDQCPRDTPDSNLEAMVDAAKRYGRYQ
jgi:uroporphyrinogen decarboxylase